MSIKKISHGGHREGSGRKRLTNDVLSKSITAQVSEKEYTLIKEKAKEKGLTISQYIRRVLIKKITP